MAQSYVQVPVDGAGKKIDAWVTGVAAQYRQSIVIADPDTDGNYVAISSRLRLPVELEQLFDFDSGVGSAVGSGIGIMLPANGGPVIGGTTANPFNISAASLPLPTGAATAANQSTINTSIQAINTLLTSQLDVLLSTRASEATLAAAAASLAILDDWDESDRAKVNLIVGQAGITAAAGAVAANTPRFTLASDDPAVAVLGAINGAAVITDANGTIQQYLRGLIKLAITAGAFLVTVASKSIYVKQLNTAAWITVINTATDIAAGNFSGAPAASFTNNDAACPGALYLQCMLEVPDWASAPVAGTTVDLYGIILNVDGTDDETDAPSGTSAGGAHYFGSFFIAAVDALQRRLITVSLLGITEEMSIDFYIKNGTSQNMNNDGGTSCVLKVRPTTTVSIG